MWTDLVVASDPLRGHLANLAERFEHVAVQHLLSIRSIQAFNVAVLHRPPRLDEAALDAVTPSPLLELLADELGTVVDAQRCGSAAQLDELIERAHDAPRRQVRIDLDPQHRKRTANPS